MPEGADKLCPVGPGSKLASDNFEAFFQRWDEARGGNDLPHMSHIRPTEIAPRFLPHITIIGVENEGTRFVIRLAGSAIRDVSSVEMTGWEVDEAKQDPVPLPASQASLERMKWSIANRQPYCLGAQARWSGNDMLAQRTLVLPYVGDDGTVQRFLTLNDLEFTPDPCHSCPMNTCAAAANPFGQAAE